MRFLRGLLILGMMVTAAAFVSAQEGGSTSGAMDQRQEIGAALLAPVENAVRAAGNTNLDAARAAVAQFVETWEEREDAVRDIDRSSYDAIEIKSALARAALSSDTAKADATRASLVELREAIEAFAAGTASDGTRGTDTSGAVAGSYEIADLAELLTRLSVELDEGNAEEAAPLIERAITIWPSVEDVVRGKSPGIYASMEDGLTQTAAAIRSNPPDTARARSLVSDMLGGLAVVENDNGGYSAVDAGLILLREGLEALLVLSALLAMLKKSGKQQLRAWVWSGSGVGILVSVVVALLLGFAVSAATSATVREEVEGFVGIASVALMLTVGAWLHRNANIMTWNKYVKNKVGAALERGSAWGLFGVAALAVAREGVETVVFYIGIAPGIGTLSLILGIAGAAVLLAAAGFVMIRLSVRLPLHYLFLAATILIYYLAVKILGESIHALQISSVISISHAPDVPRISFLGVFPTLETIIPQAIVAAFVITSLVWGEVKQRRARTAATTRQSSR